MKIIVLKLINHLFLFAAILIISCNEQTKPPPSDEQRKLPEVPLILADQIAEYIRHIYQDKEGDFWFGTNSLGVAHYDGNNLSYFGREQGFGGTQITGITEDPDKNMWFATDEGVVKYDFGTTISGAKQFTNFSKDEFFDGQRFWSIYADSKGDIWAGGRSNIFRRHKNDWTVFELPYTSVHAPKKLLSDIVTWGVTEDSKGNIWFATNGNGIIKYDGASFVQYTENDGLANNLADHILEDSNGNIWIGTREGGASLFDGDKFINFTARDSIGNNEVCVIFEDKEANIWMSSEGFGLYRYNGKSFKNFFNKEGLHVRAVQVVYEDQAGRLWTGGGGGLYRLDGEYFVNVSKDGPWE